MFKNKVHTLAKALSEKIEDSVVYLNSTQTINSGFIKEVLVTIETNKGNDYYIIGLYPDGNVDWRKCYDV